MAQYCSPQSVPKDKIQQTADLKIPEGGTVQFEFKTKTGGGGTSSELGRSTSIHGLGSEFVLKKDQGGDYKVDINQNIASITAIVKDKDGKENRIDLLAKTPEVVKPEAKTEPKVKTAPVVTPEPENEQVAKANPANPIAKQTAPSLSELVIPMVPALREAANDLAANISAQRAEIAKGAISQVADFISSKASWDALGLTPKPLAEAPLQEPTPSLPPVGAVAGGSALPPPSATQGAAENPFITNPPAEAPDPSTPLPVAPPPTAPTPETPYEPAPELEVPVPTKGQIAAAERSIEVDKIFDLIESGATAPEPSKLRGRGLSSNTEEASDFVEVKKGNRAPEAEKKAEPIAKEPEKKAPELDLTKLAPDTQLSYTLPNGQKGSFTVPKPNEYIEKYIVGNAYLVRNQDKQTFSFDPKGTNVTISDGKLEKGFGATGAETKVALAPSSVASINKAPLAERSHLNPRQEARSERRQARGVLDLDSGTKVRLGQVTELTGKELQNFLIKYPDQKALVIGFADSCGPCRQYTTQYRAFAAQNPNIAVIKVDTSENADFTSKYSIHSIPSTQLKSPGSTTLGLVVNGYMDLNTLNSKYRY